MASYEIGEVIGRGAMGVVHRGHQAALGRDVAIKCLREEYAAEELVLSRFLREAHYYARLNHPNIVHVYDVVEEGNGHPPYIVMELLDGETLHARLKRGALSEAEAIAITVPVLNALERAHEAGIVHRDVKPGNVFLCADGQVKMTDFGIARAAGEAALTGVGLMIGTPQYLAPEQAREGEADARSDLYSAGILLYQMLTGRVPFQAETPLAVLYLHVEKPPPPLPATIAPWLREVVERALQKNPDDRFQTAAEFRDALQHPVAPPSEQKALLNGAVAEADEAPTIFEKILVAPEISGEKELPPEVVPEVESGSGSTLPAHRWRLAAALGLAVLTVAAALAITLWPHTEKSRVTEKFAIQHETETRPSFALALGKEKVLRAGKNGERIMVREITYRSNAFGRRKVGSKVVQEKDVSQPVKEIKLVGSREVVTKTQKRALPFPTTRRAVSSLSPGSERTTRAGVNGQEEITSKVVYKTVDGKRQEMSRPPMGHKMLKAPVARIVEYGSKRKPLLNSRLLKPNPDHGGRPHPHRPRPPRPHPVRPPIDEADIPTTDGGREAGVPRRSAGRLKH